MADDIGDIADRGQASGELFDLSIPSFNNNFGYEYIQGTITHGISLPLDKYIRELEMILYGGGPRDDKSEKRKKRLAFLRICNANPELQIMFPLFTNYLNGGGEGDTIDKHGNPRNTFNDFNYQYNQRLIITVAGGNIVTIFSELIMNMIDTFIKVINIYESGSSISNKDKDWDLMDDTYMSADYINDNAYKMANNMFRYNFKNWPQSALTTLNDAFEMLTISNKELLKLTAYKTRLTKEKVYFKICKFILDDKEKTSFGNHYNIMDYIAKSNHSDFDFKLSPNIASDPESTINYLYRELDNLSPDDPAGFLLVRVKSFIICNTNQYNNPKKFKRDCYSKLSINDYKNLYPQMINQGYLKKVPNNSDCYKFIQYLLDEKEAIGHATYDNVHEILKYFLNGYYKPSNVPGQPLPIIPAANNSTEAMINYLNRTSYFLNIFIKNWEKINNCPPYTKIIYSFLGLKNILTYYKSFIPRLASGIINFFLNNPEFQTEQILDNLIANVNLERRRKGLNNCHMPHSSLQLISSNRDLTPGLKKIKEALEEVMDSPEDDTKTFYDEDKDYSQTPAHLIPIPQGRRLGFPDGIRITINAITTLARTPDTLMDLIEDQEISKMNSLKLNLSNLTIPLSSYGGNRKNKKTKRKNKKYNKSKKKHKKYKKSKVNIKNN